eukprot:Amastigsp_a677021_19.p3 type:complete len:114 gc:universal Amastigsp_a677021_19:76-417(+)
MEQRPLLTLFSATVGVNRSPQAFDFLPPDAPFAAAYAAGNTVALLDTTWAENTTPQVRMPRHAQRRGDIRAARGLGAAVKSPRSVSHGTGKNSRTTAGSVSARPRFADSMSSR